PGNARNTVTLWASCSPDGDATVTVRLNATDDGVALVDLVPTLEVWGHSDPGYPPALSSAQPGRRGRERGRRRVVPAAPRAAGGPVVHAAGAPRPFPGAAVMSSVAS
ncbi:hypothetical protein, partial [Isoptericola haloaureus]